MTCLCYRRPHASFSPITLKYYSCCRHLLIDPSISLYLK
ncbi:unnamed protein product [Staurois parvus]|uniref:Uncharacterized protein n=1 Tax=Staurois parvus TaxID=386267 RepID=A0ABN9CC92_9NEOB|nr:unnamed protein product [Staurois parvus]